MSMLGYFELVFSPCFEEGLMIPEFHNNMWTYKEMPLVHYDLYT